MWEVQKPRDPEKVLKLEELERELDNAESYRDLPDWMVYPALMSHYAMERVLLKKQVEALKKELNM